MLDIILETMMLGVCWVFLLGIAAALFLVGKYSLENFNKDNKE